MKYKLSLTFGIAMVIGQVMAQSGCTDPQANNYQPLATINDGSCTYDSTFQTAASIGDISGKVTESSGLILIDGYVWSLNDAGNPAEVFKIDTSDGSIVQTLTLTNYPNTDWEDMTADSNYLYVGDFGNNDGNRKDLKVLKIDKSQFIGSTAPSVNVTAQAIEFSYSDQSSYTPSSTHNFDCESVISVGDYLYLFTKDRGDFQTRVYKLSKVPGAYVLTPITSYDVHGLITGADYNPNNGEVVLVGYFGGHKSSFMYYLDDYTGDQFFSGNKRRIEIGNATTDWQTEGVTFDTDTRLFISCETSYVPATLYYSEKSSWRPLGVESIENTDNMMSVYPNPTNRYLHIDLPSNNGAIIAALYTTNGQLMMEKTGKGKFIELDLGTIDKGMYVLEVQAGQNDSIKKVILYE